jgi:hypothetical protein
MNAWNRFRILFSTGEPIEPDNTDKTARKLARGSHAEDWHS